MNEVKECIASVKKDLKAMFEVKDYAWAGVLVLAAPILVLFSVALSGLVFLLSLLGKLTEKCVQKHLD